jgi:hypothetical protein
MADAVPETTPQAEETAAPEGAVPMEVRVRSRVKPDYPVGAQGRYSADVMCVLRLRIDTAGLVTAVTPRGCPADFVESATAAARQWTFYPCIGLSGVPIPVQFDLTIVFSVTPHRKVPYRVPSWRVGLQGGWWLPSGDAAAGPEMLASVGADRGWTSADGVIGYRSGGLVTGGDLDLRLFPEGPVSAWLGGRASLVLGQVELPVYLGIAGEGGVELGVRHGPTVRLGVGVEGRLYGQGLLPRAYEGVVSVAWTF